MAAGTTFPLLQTVMVVDGDSVDGDATAQATGGSAAVDGTGLFVINTEHMHPGQTTVSGMNGDPFIWDSDNLDWTRAGYWNTGGAWDYLESPFVHRGVFVAGYETRSSDMPTSGTATFNGRASGAVYYPVTLGSGNLLCNCDEAILGGEASFTANFGARTVTGSLTHMWAGGDPWFDDPLGQWWNDVAFSATITGNAFSGGTQVTSVPGGVRGLAGNATGTIEGRFFGPSAQEAGAVWTLFDGVKAAIGTLTAKDH